MILTTKVRIRPDAKEDFVQWQARFNHAIAAFPGFSSLEISCAGPVGNLSWEIVQRFQDSASTSAWLHSDTRSQFIEELILKLTSKRAEDFQDIAGGAEGLRHGITEVFVTQVSPDKEVAYRAWIAKIHQAEARFPGFQRAYVQAPKKGGVNWITFLQFDTQDNLDHWLTSDERKQVLEEGKPLIESLESHRVISPYAGWFASVSTSGESPSVWKQTMLVLLVLFPIVMLELKYLPLLTANLNPALSTFIGNAISVWLIAWPMMPIALFFLSWWLVPKKASRGAITLYGTLLILVLYLIEIVIFWNLL